MNFKTFKLYFNYLIPLFIVLFNHIHSISIMILFSIPNPLQMELTLSLIYESNLLYKLLLLLLL
jgi:hypothetical protein